jgi:hypothetical protein
MDIDQVKKYVFDLRDTENILTKLQSMVDSYDQYIVDQFTFEHFFLNHVNTVKDPIYKNNIEIFEMITLGDLHINPITFSIEFNIIGYKTLSLVSSDNNSYNFFYGDGTLKHYKSMKYNKKDAFHIISWFNVKTVVVDYPNITPMDNFKQALFGDWELVDAETCRVTFTI